MKGRVPTESAAARGYEHASRPTVFIARSSAPTRDDATARQAEGSRRRRDPSRRLCEVGSRLIDVNEGPPERRVRCDM